MKKKKEEDKKLNSKQMYSIIIAVIIVVVILVVFLLVRAKYEKATYQDKFYFAGQYSEKVIGNDNYIFVSEEELKYIFPEQKFDSIDFEKYHYALVTIPYDSCSEDNINPIRYSIKNNVILVEVEYEASCGVCAHEYLYYLIEIDQELEDVTVDIDYHATNNPHCDPNVSYKPMIYLYPEKEEDVQVTLGHPEYLTTTYPKYEDSWKVIAYPDGTLKNITHSREYYGLYWEGSNHTSYVHDNGFVVKGEETASFLEEKLGILGLSDKEANEFIVYWLPKLEHNLYNYIYFETIHEINTYMPLEVIPKPDTIIRIQMDYMPLEKPISIQEQKIIPVVREGFTLVEWGGSIIKK